MKENNSNNPQCSFSLQTSTLVCVPDKDFMHIQLQTINVAESKSNILNSVNNPLHAHQRKYSLGIGLHVNQKEEVA